MHVYTYVGIGTVVARKAKERVVALYTCPNLIEYTFGGTPALDATTESLMFPHLFLDGKGFYMPFSCKACAGIHHLEESCHHLRDNRLCRHTSHIIHIYNP